MALGVVKWFSEVSGLGFIELDEAGEEVYFHYSAMKMVGSEPPECGDRVVFQLEVGDGGLEATNLEILDR